MDFKEGETFIIGVSGQVGQSSKAMPPLLDHLIVNSALRHYQYGKLSVKWLTKKIETMIQMFF